MNLTINPNELKPAREWLNYLPEPIKSEAIEACEKWPSAPNKQCVFYQCIDNAFGWFKTGNYGKWSKIDTQLRNSEILPVSPEAEPYKPMTDHEAQIAQLRAEIAAIKKEIEMMKAEPTPTPEPKQVKLPVTIDEVWEQEYSMTENISYIVCKNKELRSGTFDEMNRLINEYRTEKTAKKALAFLTLLKIAEAQNEVAERGQVVFTGRKAVDEVVSALINPLYGQIYFHSEQGLRDCIAANEQLWKDYLEIAN